MTDKPSYPCPKCGKVFGRPQHLRLHLSRKIPCTASAQPQNPSKADAPLAKENEPQAQPQAAHDTTRAPAAVVIVDAPLPPLPEELQVQPEKPAKVQAAAPSPATFIIDESVVRMIINAPYEAARIATGYPGFQAPYDDKDYAQVSPIANRVADKYLPGMMKEHADVIALAIFVLGPMMAQTMAYLEWKKQQQRGGSMPAAPTPAGVQP